MNPTAINMFSTFGVVVACIVLGIMALSIFFSLLNWIWGSGAKPEALTIRGTLKKDTWATVHMTGTETFERVRLIGFIGGENIKGPQLPYDLYGMVILEDELGAQFIVRAKSIRMISIPPAKSDGKL